MRYPSFASFCSVLTYITAFPTSLSSPLLNLFMKDDSTSGPLKARLERHILTGYTTTISNPHSVPDSIVCSTSASITRYTKFQIIQTTVVSAGDVIDNIRLKMINMSKFEFSQADQPNLAVAQADPLLPPSFMKGCDVLDRLWWSPMITLGNSRSVTLGRCRFSLVSGQG